MTIALPRSIFASAITLSEAELRRALLSLWPNLLAYALSFAVIGIMWQNHHALFRCVTRIDRKTVFYNLLLLSGTAFIPFATSTLGAYPTMNASTFLYGVVLSYCSIAYNLMLRHLIRADAFPTELTETVRQTARHYRIGLATYASAMLLALAAPIVSFALYVLIAGYYLVPRGIDDDLRTA